MTRAPAALLGAAIAIVLSVSCAGLNSQTYSYATLAEAREAGAIARGFIPEGLPPSSHDIRVAQVPGSPQHWGIVDFPAAEADILRGLLRPEELSLEGARCEMPARIEWWPQMLRGQIDWQRSAATGLRAYRAKDSNLIVAVNWSQGRAYYWVAEP